MSFGGRDLGGEIVEAGLARSRQELALQERDAAVRVRDAYGRLIQPTREVVRTWEGQATTPQEWQRVVDLQALQDGMEYGLADMESLLALEQGELSQAAIQTGMQYAEFSAGIPVGWNVPDAAAIARMADYVDRPAMRAALAQYGEYHAGQVADIALAGMSRGWNPRRTAQAMLAYLDRMPLADAERMMRTSQLWSYREANLASWRENSNVVRGWIWWASLDERTCVGCISQHGTRHGLNETLNDHHNGRCGPLPEVVGRELPAENAGEEWFGAQPERVQVRMMGRARWMAWRDGAFGFDQLSMPYNDAVYGEMRTETPLGRLVPEGEAQRYGEQARAERQGIPF